MTMAGFLTLLTLLVAIYALLPRATRLRVRLGVRLQISTAIIAFLLVLYVQFNVQVIRACTAVRGRACEWLPSLTGDSITSPELNFLIVIAWMGIGLRDLQVIFATSSIFVFAHYVQNC